MRRLDVPFLMRLHRVADQLGVSQRTVRRMVQRGELPPIVKVGRSSCLPTDEVLGFIDRQRKGGRRS